MANLITAYYTKTRIPKNIEFVPGDIIVLGKKENILFFGEHQLEELYIVDLYRIPMLIGKRCQICERFHINHTHYISYLGKHWKKYQQRYFDIGLPLTNNQCSVIY